MEEKSWAASQVLAALQAARDQDLSFADGDILGSMCTQPHEIAAVAYSQFLPTNLGDPDHFPGTARLEQEILADFAQLAGNTAATARLTSGGTEANILACYMAREQTGKRKIVLSEAAHFSFEKAARLLGMERVVVPGPYKSNPQAITEAIDGDTALVVAITGTTELGLVDDVVAIASAARESQVHCHVDAAFGGYVLPFTDSAPWNLAVPGVTSLSMDPHKMGMAPIPAGALLRQSDDWDTTAVETDYVSTTSQSTLMGTRPGAAAAAVWAVHRRLGMSGYRGVVQTALDNTQYLAKRLQAAGAELIQEPELNVIGFRGHSHKKIAAAGFRTNLLPRFSGQRIVVGPHVSRSVIDKFMTAYEAL